MPNGYTIKHFFYSSYIPSDDIPIRFMPFYGQICVQFFELTGVSVSGLCPCLCTMTFGYRYSRTPRLLSSGTRHFVTAIQRATHDGSVAITMVHDVLWSLYFHHITCWSFYFAGNTHYKFIRRCYIFLSDNKSFTSHESHESHKDCIAKGSQLSALPSVYEPDGKHERSKCSSWDSWDLCENQMFVKTEVLEI